jgi:hypothetical protein
MGNPNVRNNVLCIIDNVLCLATGDRPSLKLRLAKQASGCWRTNPPLKGADPPAGVLLEIELKVPSGNHTVDVTFQYPGSHQVVVTRNDTVGVTFQ